MNIARLHAANKHAARVLVGRLPSTPVIRSNVIFVRCVAPLSVLLKHLHLRYYGVLTLTFVLKCAHGPRYGNCPSTDYSSTVTCVSGFPPQTLVVPVFNNATLNAPSTTNAALRVWQTQKVGDEVPLNPEFVRLFKLVMEPMARHMRANGWIDRTFAFITDEPRWPCYNSGSNFTVNAWIALTRLYRALDPAIRVQQDLTPMAAGPTWDAVSPLVDAWVWQEGQHSRCRGRSVIRTHVLTRLLALLLTQQRNNYSLTD